MALLARRQGDSLCHTTLLPSGSFLKHLQSSSFPPLRDPSKPQRCARSERASSLRFDMHCGPRIATMLLLVSRTEALLTGIATPRRHGAVSVQANLLTKVRVTLPRAPDRVCNPGPFNEAAASIQALVILSLGRTLTSPLPAHPGEPSLL